MARTWQELINPKTSPVLLNPTLPEQLKAVIEATTRAHQSPSSITWIMSSGSSSESAASFKLIALSQKSLLASAQAVNKHLEVTKGDRWLNVLPLFHVGGLGILYRSFLSETEGINLWSETYKWNPTVFAKSCHDHRITLTSLVPTQVYDLILGGHKPPLDLRAIVVGGARLEASLYHRARALGWPLLPSFGMTEACSQVATAPMESLSRPTSEMPPLKLLTHLKARIDQEDRLWLAGSSLLEGYYQFIDGQCVSWVDPKDSSGWMRTQDCAHWNEPFITILARADDVIKTRGENVNLFSLRKRLEENCIQSGLSTRWTIVAIPHSRIGTQLVLVGEGSTELGARLQAQFNQQVLPFERLEQVVANHTLPLSDLGKILYRRLTEDLAQVLLASD